MRRMKKGAIYRTFRKGANTIVVVAASEYRGEMRLDIRQFWSPNGDDEYVPTKKGVNISFEEVPEFLAALVNVVGEVDEDLLDDIR